MNKWCDHIHKRDNTWWHGSVSAEAWSYCAYCGAKRSEEKFIRPKDRLKPMTAVETSIKAIFDKNHQAYPSPEDWKEAMIKDLKECIVGSTEEPKKLWEIMSCNFPYGHRTMSDLNFESTANVAKSAFKELIDNIYLNEALIINRIDLKARIDEL